MTDITLTELKADTNNLVADEAKLRSFYGETHPLAVKKSQPTLDQYSSEFIKRSPFLCLSTQHRDGTADVSPRGDPAGFVRVLDDSTLVIPDRPGNNRLDSLSNIISNPSVGLLFLVPGFDDTLRVNGRAILSRNPELLASMQVKNRTPTLAIVIEIHEVFLHCAKAFRRAKLWHIEAIQDRKQLPSLAAIVTEQVSGKAIKPTELESLEKELEEEYQQTMY